MAQTAKIMLVEDDINLSEIYQARMVAEGYQVVAAHDGEAALALAAREKPDLIIADVMMPKISGFEMLDILRNTEGLKSTKVIMLTALGQAEDKDRAQSLGADRYLVKSQVTLEDIVKNAQELLGSEGMAAPTPAPTAAPSIPAQTQTPAATPPAAPAVAMPQPTAIPVAAPPAEVAAAIPPAVVQPATPTSPTGTIQPSVAPVPVPSQTPTAPPAGTNDSLLTNAVNDLLNNVPYKAKPAAATPPVTPTPEPQPTPPASHPSTIAPAPVLDSVPMTSAPPVVPAPSTPATASPTTAAPPPTLDTRAPGDNTPITHKKVIKPIDGIKKPDLNSLLAAEEAKAAPTILPAAAPVPPRQPGNVFTPSNPVAHANGTTIDPNSIAL